MLALSCTSIVLLGALWINSTRLQFLQETTKLNDNFRQRQEEAARREIENMLSFVHYLRTSSRDRLKQNLRTQVDAAHAMALELHDALVGHLPGETIKDSIVHALAASRYNEGRGYYFVISGDGTMLLNPATPGLVGQRQMSARDPEGHFVIEDILTVARERQAGFYEYKWPKPDAPEPQRKLSFVRLFEPYGWVIGTGEYLDDTESDIQHEVLRMLAGRAFGHSGYLFAGTWDGQALLGPGRGRNILDLTDPNGVKVTQELIAAARSGGGFVEHSLPSLDDTGHAAFAQKPQHCVSYAAGIPEWQWFIAANIDLDAVNVLLDQRRTQQVRDIQTRTALVGCVLLILVGAAYALSRRLSARIRANLDSFSEFFQTAAEEHTHIDSSALTYDDFTHLAHAANRMIDARLRAVMDLRASEERFTLLIEQSPFAIEIYNTDGTLIRANRACTRLWGSAHPDGYNILADPIAVKLGIAEALRRALSGETVIVSGIEYIPARFERSGRTRYIHTRAYPLRGEDNTIHFATLMHEDITSRREAERDRDRIFETSVDMLSISDTEGHFRRLNPAWQQTLGWSEQEIMTTPFLEFVHPDDHEATLAALQTLARGEPLTGFENRYRRKDGTYRWIAWNSHPDPERQEIYGVARDITAQKNAEAEALRLRLLLGSIVNSMPSVLVGVDRDCRVTQWNSHATETTGISSEHALGHPMEEVLPLTESDLATIREAVAEQRPREIPRRQRYHGGQRIWENITIYPLEDDPTGGAVIRLDDVTERTRMESMMIQSEKMMSIGGLAAGMAHEINNPLGGILHGVQNIARRLSPDIATNVETARRIGCELELIRDYLDRRKIMRMLDGIRSSGERAARIVASLLDFSRSSESRMAPHQLADIIDETLTLATTDFDIKTQIDTRGITIERVIDDKLPPVPCTRTEIQQVLLNLVRNAVQALHDHRAPDTIPTITLRLSKTQTHAVIEIEDNGPGLPQHIRDRVFEPFFTTRDPGAGTGLGLTVSYFIITQNHSGEFEAHSEPGKGTLFVIRLPLSRGQEQETAHSD
nr:cache domain-containing protein [Desulfobaculum xiamenense]